MGMDEGFDMFPPLKSSDQPQWDRFLDAVRSKYKDDQEASLFEDEEAGQLTFRVGQNPALTYNCTFFRRFSARVNGYRNRNIEIYLNEVGVLCRSFCPEAVRSWSDMTLTCTVAKAYSLSEVRKASEAYHTFLETGEMPS